MLSVSIMVLRVSLLQIHALACIYCMHMAVIFRST